MFMAKLGAINKQKSVKSEVSIMKLGTSDILRQKINKDIQELQEKAEQDRIQHEKEEQDRLKKLKEAEEIKQTVQNKFKALLEAEKVRQAEVERKREDDLRI
tara:strand:+ start:61 stop:366 length:306 start_codon:yes stop_codon:yes gene_type:complete